MRVSWHGQRGRNFEWRALLEMYGTLTFHDSIKLISKPISTLSVFTRANNLASNRASKFPLSTLHFSFKAARHEFICIKIWCTFACRARVVSNSNRCKQPRGRCCNIFAIGNSHKEMKKKMSTCKSRRKSLSGEKISQTKMVISLQLLQRPRLHTNFIVR
jgi:hypothetical protein